MTAIPTISELARAARTFAGEVVVRHKKKASFRLYEVLASCMQICERSDLDPADRAELEQLVSDQPKDGNRRYVEKGSSIYLLVCRYVFAGSNLTNCARYSQALNEAAKMQIGSETIAKWMRENGGVNALYFKRPLDQTTVSMKTLRLAQSVTVSRGQAFDLRLRWKNDNTFEVISTSSPMEID